MANLYELSRADGSPSWKDGTGFGTAWNDAEDRLRFHRGAMFEITNRATGATGPKRKLIDLEPFVRSQLDDSPPGTVIAVRSLADGFTLILRRDHEVDVSGGDRYIKLLETKLGLLYLIDTAPPSGTSDCSGLTMWGLERRGVDGIPHNAAQQHALFGSRSGFVTIPQSKLVPGDLVFIDMLRHVASYKGMYRGHPCVVDTEPHDTVAPWGGMLGTGVQVRPMDGNYYCARVVSCGRIVSINGPG